MIPKNEENRQFNDPIAEIHRIRDEHAQKFHYDIDAIIDDLRRWEQEQGIKTVALPPKRLKPKASS